MEQKFRIKEEKYYNNSDRFYPQLYIANSGLSDEDGWVNIGKISGEDEYYGSLDLANNIITQYKLKNEKPHDIIIHEIKIEETKKENKEDETI